MPVAVRYWQGKAAWESLLAAGYSGLVDCYDRCPERLAGFTGTAEEYKRRYRDSPDHWASWWVRQHIVAAAQIYAGREDGVLE